jgi:hypothetical protein
MASRSIFNGSLAFQCGFCVDTKTCKSIKEGTCLTTITEVEINNESIGLGPLYFKFVIPRLGEYMSSNLRSRADGRGRPVSSSQPENRGEWSPKGSTDATLNGP